MTEATRASNDAPGSGLPGGEHAYRNFVESVADYALILLDKGGFIRSWNLGAERIKGYRADEIIGQHFSRFYPPEDVRAGKCERELEVASATGRFEELGWRVRKDGSRFFANVVITAVHDDRGELVGFGKVTRDVTERRVADEQLRASEERFRLLTEGVRDYAIIMLDPEGHITSWNQGAEAIKQYTRDEILGEHFSRFYPDEDVRAGKCERILESALRDGRFEESGWRVRKDGSRFFANVVIRPLRGPDGRLRGFAKVTRDLTERRQAEEFLRQSEERFRLLVEGVGDYAIFMLDPGGVIRSWNAGAQTIKGYTAAEAIGRHFSIFYPPEDVAAGKCEQELRVALEQGRFEVEGWRLRKGGERFWANVVITPIHTPDGKLYGYAKVTRDLTVRRRTEEMKIKLAEEQVARRDAEERARERAELVSRLEEANAQLAEAVRARDDFLSMASHELKTPLHTLSLQVSTTQYLVETQDPPRERLRGRLQSAQLEVQRLSRLMNNLLDISRIAANRLVMEPQREELRGIVQDVVEREKDEVARHGSAVTIEDGEEIHGVWDRLRVEQVVTNLLSNALKYGDRKPVTIRLARVGDRARIVVVDQGLGIEPADQARIFERFERAVSSRSHSGFGLGLWIVRQIVDAMGGTIRVESQKGVGSTFVVEVPLETVAVPPPTPA